MANSRNPNDSASRENNILDTSNISDPLYYHPNYDPVLIARRTALENQRNAYLERRAARQQAMPAAPSATASSSGFFRTPQEPEATQPRYNLRSYNK